MNDREFEKLMSASAVRQVQLLNDSIPTDEELDKIIPSENFEQYIQMIIAKDEKREKRLKSRKRLGKIAASFVIITVIAFGAVMSVDANRSYFFQMFDRAFSISGQQQNDSWNKEFNAQVAANCHNVYLPSWMPDGFKATKSSQGDQGTVITYSNGNNTIRIIQNDNSGNILNDAEVKTMEKNTVAGQIYYYSEKERSGNTYQKLIWRTEKNSFTLDSTTINKDELFKVAQSLVLKRS